MLIAEFVIFAVPFEYKATHAYCENSTDTYMEYYMEEEPYNTTEEYVDIEEYNTTVLLKYVKISSAEMKCSPRTCYCSWEIATIKNTDNVGGKFKVKVFWYNGGGRYLGYDLTNEVYLNPGEVYEFNGIYPSNKEVCNYKGHHDYEIIPPTKEVVMNRTITKTRDVIKYKNVTKTRDVTKHYSVKKQIKIMKEATLFEQWTGKATRYEDTNCKVNDEVNASG